MEKQVLGKTGLEVTVAGLGCGGASRIGMFTHSLEHAAKIVRSAYDQGINFFDTAYAYGTQPAVGLGLQGIPRCSYILSSKFAYKKDGHLRPVADLQTMVNEALVQLHTDYIDIYHMHGVAPADYAAARDRFYPELRKLVDQGKIRFTGISELFGTDTIHAMAPMALADNIWDVMMIGYNILNPSALKRVFPQVIAQGVGLLNMFAVRTALSNREQLEKDIQKMKEAAQVDPRLVPGAEALDFIVREGYASSLIEAAYRFCRHTPGIAVTLTGTASEEHLKENLRTFSLPPLPQEALDKLNVLFGRVDCVSGQ